MKHSVIAVFLIITALSVPPRTSCAQSASPLYLQANKMYNAGRFADAIPLYQAAIASPSRDISPGTIHTRIGDSYFRLADYPRAADSYRAALKEQNGAERAPTQYWIGFCTFLQGRNEEAVTEFLKIPELYPASGMWVHTAYYWAGRASERMGRKEQAGELYRKAAGKGRSTQERFAQKKADNLKK